MRGCTGGRRPAITVLLAALLATTSGYGAASASAAVRAAPTAVKIAVSATGNGTVGTGFAGFSYEKDRIGAGMFDTGNADLVRLFRLLGPGVLRLGGNLVDMTRWNAAGKGGSATQTAPADVTRLAAFLKRDGLEGHLRHQSEDQHRDERRLRGTVRGDDPRTVTVEVPAGSAALVVTG
jgi:hypothetical protein